MLTERIKRFRQPLEAILRAQFGRAYIKTQRALF